MEKVDYDFLYNLIMKEYDSNIAESVFSSYKSHRFMTLRVNTLKCQFEDVIKALEQNNYKYEIYPSIPNAIIILENQNIEDLDIYKNGEIYLQSLSSMLPPLALNPNSSDHILDMAAAPGSKTSQVAALANNEACITACEMHPMRAERLKYNLNKLGATRVTVLVKDARTLDEFFRFNKIMLDAPCSGSGTIDRNVISKQRMNKDIIKKCQDRQISLLKKGLSLLNKGGTLVYSTCSILKEENEDVLLKCLNNHYELVPLEINDLTNNVILPSKLPHVLTLAPNEYFEGFFVAKIKRID